jgi:hypothetical protein
MLRLGILAGLVFSGLASTGCTTSTGATNNTGTDALAGGALGAGAGAVLGSLAHAPVAGAVLGGALGASTGAAIGSSQDRLDQRQANQQAIAQAQMAQAQQRLTPQQVVDLVTKNVDETLIVNQIHTYGCVPLSTDDLSYLQQCRVSARVIGEMQQAAARPLAPPGVVIAGPGPIYAPYYAPPPPGYYWRGGYYYRY